MKNKLIKKSIIRTLAEILSVFIWLYRKIRPIEPAVYFCYNQSVHQIYHSLFIAIELSNIQDEYPVVVLSTSQEASVIIEQELNSIPNKVRFQKIRHPGYGRTAFDINLFVFLCRLRMYRTKAVVVTDYFDNVFRQLFVKTFWVYVSHGVANREFSFEPHIKDYDLVILPGERDLKAMQERIGPLNNCRAAGYSKLDYFHYHVIKSLNLFKEKRPVILYNPHFDEKFSSFFDKGLVLLEQVSKSNKFNVLFMPHPDLSRKYPQLVKKTAEFENVLLIERHRINLEYMAQADVYITDISSSVFEWLYFDKPVLFFNTKRVNWKKSRDYPSWVLGKVAEDVLQLIVMIEDTLKHQEEFREIRRETFEDTFANRDKVVSKAIAEIIRDRIRG
ncbi:MAG: CDP-glycerol glycerophosphotransferase family protein [Candidatus Omnitrophica bacterium]|nr:CDP-glycerol glycerophosphotransferase family protein [Candidatus Omnitrophota bacterium]